MTDNEIDQFLRDALELVTPLSEDFVDAQSGFLVGGNPKAKELVERIREALDDEDPTPWCAHCGAKSPRDCDCGPIAANN